jgi:hypothetical protein
MDEILRTWPVAFFPVLILCSLASWASRRIAATLDELGDTIRSRHDLSLLRRAINLNMATAMLLLILGALYIALLHYSMRAGHISSNRTLAAYAAFSALSFMACHKLRISPVERRAREMTILCDDPGVEETYRRWLRQWREARLWLPRD